MALYITFMPPREGQGLSRECVLRIPSVSRKRRLIGAVCRDQVYKKVGPVSVLGRAR